MRIWHMYLFNFLRFRICLHSSAVLLDLGTAKYELNTALFVTQLKIAPFLRSPWISLSGMLEANEEMVGLHATVLCLGTLMIQVGL